MNSIKLACDRVKWQALVNGSCSVKGVEFFEQLLKEDSAAIFLAYCSRVLVRPICVVLWP
jgi:hypothetical protein